MARCGCGASDYGELGLGDVISRSSPTQVGALTTWLNVTIANYHTVAIKTDGTIWSWGIGDTGRLGHGNVVSRSSPVQIGGLTNWLQVTAMDDFTAAVKTDGTLWTWGTGTSGQLGNDIRLTYLLRFK